MKIIILLLSLVAGVSSFAQTSTMPLPKLEDGPTFPWDRDSLSRVRTYLGVSVGQASESAGVSMKGPPAKVQILGSFHFSALPCVADAGLGLFNQAFSQSASGADRVNALSMDLGARWVSADRWQFGPALLTLFNQGGVYGSKSSDAQFGGVQVLREFNLDRRHIARFGGRWVNSLNVPGAGVGMALIDFQIGWDSARKNVLEKRVIQVAGE